jgi:hypothetical protein
MEEMVFDGPEVIEVPVTIFGKRYVLREANSEVSAKYKNTILKATKLSDDGGSQTFKDGYAEAALVLVAGCLFEKYEHPQQGTLERPVSLQQVKALPNRVFAPLFDKAKEISRLEVQNDEAKKKQTSGTDTSELPPT